MPEPTENALLSAVAKGDAAAFELLHKRFFRPVFGFSYRIVNSVELAEEVTSDTMLTVWRKAASFEGRSRASTWVFGIAYRLALRARGLHLRHDDRHEMLPDDIAADRSGSDEIETLFLRDQLARAMRALPPKQRAVVELTYTHGYSYDEIALIVGCPVGTVKTRMLHARAGLRDVLSGQGDMHFKDVWNG